MGLLLGRVDHVPTVSEAVTVVEISVFAVTETVGVVVTAGVGDVDPDTAQV